MSKRIEINGKFYRKRDGKLVEIPTEWVGKTLHPQTKRKRQSKQTKSIRDAQVKTERSGFIDGRTLELFRRESRSGQF